MNQGKVFLVRDEWCEVLHAYYLESDAWQHVKDHNVFKGYVESVSFGFPVSPGFSPKTPSHSSAEMS